MTRTSRLAAAAGFLAAALLLVCGAARAADSATADDTARILGGMPPSAASPLAALAREPGWQQHARYFDSAWAGLDKHQLSSIRAWSDAHLTEPRPVVFYMFSGPDFLYADAFFDKASTYVLSGLEPVGQVPDLAAMPRGSLGRDLNELRASLNSVLNLSFFITKKMKTELNSGRLTGTLPVLYVFLERAGKTIRDVSLVALDKDGAVHPAGEAGRASAAKGVKIDFTGGDGRAQTLYYFSTDLSDGGVKTSGFLEFCKGLGLGSADSLVKSASYLMHSDNFSKVRDFLLANSSAIVQDDSGIPIRFFDPEKWHLQPFGRYLGPINIFPGRGQAKLGELFRKGKAQPIDFGIGYRWRPRESNLLLATRSGLKAAQGQ